MEIVCPHCLTRNRVPEARVAENPQCGACRQSLLPGAPVPVAGDALPRFVAATGVPVVADFWAEWCGPCKSMAPAFAAAARERPGVQFVKVDTEASPGAAGDYGIRSIPTLVLFEDGREVARVSGARPAAEIVGWLDRNRR